MLPGLCFSECRYTKLAQVAAANVPPASFTFATVYLALWNIIYSFIFGVLTLIISISCPVLSILCLPTSPQIVTAEVIQPCGLETRINNVNTCALHLHLPQSTSVCP